MSENFKWHMNVHIDRADVDIEVNYECVTIEVNDFNADTVVTFDRDLLDECLDLDNLQTLRRLCDSVIAERLAQDEADND
jgi:hypothetical protein